MGYEDWKETATHIVMLFFVIFCMKRLWLILFVVPIIAQVDGVPFKLKKGAQVVKVKPGDEVVVRLYKENIFNAKIFPNRNLKSSIYKTVNFEEGIFITDNARISFSDLYSISHITDGTMTIKNGKRGFMYGGVGGVLLGFFSALVNDKGPPMNPFAFGVILGSAGSVILGLEGVVKGAFYPNILEELVIGQGNWKIIE